MMKNKIMNIYFITLFIMWKDLKKKIILRTWRILQKLSALETRSIYRFLNMVVYKRYYRYLFHNLMIFFQHFAIMKLKNKNWRKKCLLAESCKIWVVKWLWLLNFKINCFWYKIFFHNTIYDFVSFYIVIVIEIWRKNNFSR